MNNLLKKWFQKDNLIVVILSGVLLLVIALPTGNGKANTEKKSLLSTGQQTEQPDDKNVANKGNGGYVQLRDVSMEEYEKNLEAGLKDILESMSGAGKVEVMVTFASSVELVVEKDRPITRANTTENDSEGGERIIYQTDSKESTVFRSTDSESEPYVIKTLTPKVEGVVVVAQGAGNGDVTKNIVEAVQALCNLESHKIKVVRMKSS